MKTNKPTKKQQIQIGDYVSMRLKQLCGHTKRVAYTFGTVVGYSYKHGFRVVRIDGGAHTETVHTSRMSVVENHTACIDCGSTGHNTGSNTCHGPDEQNELEDPYSSWGCPTPIGKPCFHCNQGFMHGPQNKGKAII